MTLSALADALVWSGVLGGAWIIVAAWVRKQRTEYPPVAEPRHCGCEVRGVVPKPVLYDQEKEK